MNSIAARSVALPAILDLDALDGVRDTLLEAIEVGSVSVNAAGVERVSTNALFMLLSAAGSARRNQVGLEVVNPSRVMATAIERLGLGDQFEGTIGR
ncbi:STAS domain-containing protein [Devosia rhodophyticola]|uniref:STAS domain-containing protein n=1 Tax=Devosia rhodophyticola TaxID=3026423 RepID=A0ABY7YTK7_9HYPH|nr:STAS domain-containing protein [Devosia rhodophyticola]WDR04579.1 STAS domain-containing protein [Devosia rhodophyticola]